MTFSSSAAAADPPQAVYAKNDPLRPLMRE